MNPIAYNAASTFSRCYDISWSMDTPVSNRSDCSFSSIGPLLRIMIPLSIQEVHMLRCSYRGDPNLPNHSADINSCCDSESLISRMIWSVLYLGFWLVPISRPFGFWFQQTPAFWSMTISFLHRDAPRRTNRYAKRENRTPTVNRNLSTDSDPRHLPV